VTDPPAPADSAAQETAQPQAAQRQPARGGIEPSLNINVQIHISADATAEQIEQIFKSMSTHLYQRQDEVAK
jgi:glycine cleavage system regulatory protein